MSRNLRTHLLALLLVLAFAALAVALMPAGSASAATGPTLTEEVTVAVAVGKGTEVTPEVFSAVLDGAYLSCEGIAADVPMVDLTATLTDRYGFTTTEGRHLVYVAGVVLCPAV
jgi:hypothetical protein